MRPSTAGSRAACRRRPWLRPISRSAPGMRASGPASNALVSAWTRGLPSAARASPRPRSAALARLRHWVAASRASLDASNLVPVSSFEIGCSGTSSSSFAAFRCCEPFVCTPGGIPAEVPRRRSIRHLQLEPSRKGGLHTRLAGIFRLDGGDGDVDSRRVISSEPRRLPHKSDALQPVSGRTPCCESGLTLTTVIHIPARGRGVLRLQPGRGGYYDPVMERDDTTPASASAEPLLASAAGDRVAPAVEICVNFGIFARAPRHPGRRSTGSRNGCSTRSKPSRSSRKSGTR